MHTALSGQQRIPRVSYDILSLKVQLLLTPMVLEGFIRFSRRHYSPYISLIAITFDENWGTLTKA